MAKEHRDVRSWAINGPSADASQGPLIDHLRTELSRQQLQALDVIRTCKQAVTHGQCRLQSVFAFASLKLRRTRFVPSVLRGCATRSPKGEAWWACLDSNQEPDRYERGEYPKDLNIFNDSRARLLVFMHICSRGFCGISGGGNCPDQPMTQTGLTTDTAPRPCRRSCA
jgi:hypothetical protein